MSNSNNGVVASIRSTDLRIRARDILERVRWHHATYLIETYGAQTAVLLNVEEYQKLVGRDLEIPATRFVFPESDAPR